MLDHGGNLVDACCLSALAALMAFRKPEVTVGGASGTEVIVHPPEVKEPLPLTIHHLPVAVTFGIFDVSMAGWTTGRVGPRRVLAPLVDEVWGREPSPPLGLSRSLSHPCPSAGLNRLSSSPPMQDGNTVIIDPGLKEEAAMQGRVTIMVNPNKEVCAVHKAGGVGLSSSQLFRWVHI